MVVGVYMTDLDIMLRAERTSLRTELEEVRALIATSEQRLTKIIERLRHVDGLLSDDEAEAIVNGSVMVEATPTHAVGESITDLAEKVLLRQPGKPMYYKDLTKEVQLLGGQINGTNPSATLVARLVLDDRFVRPTSKGFYGLRKDFPKARNVGARVHRARRRARDN